MNGLRPVTVPIMVASSVTLTWVPHVQFNNGHVCTMHQIYFSWMNENWYEKMGFCLAKEWDQMRGRAHYINQVHLYILWLVKLHETAEKQACSITYSRKDELRGQLS